MVKAEKSRDHKISLAICHMVKLQQMLNEKNIVMCHFLVCWTINMELNYINYVMY